MEYRDIGTSDLKVSVVGLGCNNFGPRMDLAAARALVHYAIDHGINHFDLADIYGPRGKAEEFVGEILGSKRKEIVLATKFGAPFDDSGTMQGASRKYIMTAVEGSLRRLKTDYIDLYYQHRADPSIPIEETLRALDDLVRQGKVRHIGNSNFNGRQIGQADETARKLRLDSLYLCPGRIQPDQASHRERSRPGDAAAQDRVDAVLSARQRVADRQVSARRADARRHQACRQEPSLGSVLDRG